MKHDRIRVEAHDRQAERLAIYDRAVAIVTADIGERPVQTIRLPHPSQPYPNLKSGEIISVLDSTFAQQKWDRRVSAVCRELSAGRKV